MVFTGKKVWIWVGLETNRGQVSPISYWFPRTDNTFSDKANVENDSWVVDTIVDSINSEVTKQWSEGTIWGQVYFWRRISIW